MDADEFQKLIQNLAIGMGNLLSDYNICSAYIGTDGEPVIVEHQFRFVGSSGLLWIGCGKCYKEKAIPQWLGLIRTQTD